MHDPQHSQKISFGPTQSELQKDAIANTAAKNLAQSNTARQLERLRQMLGQGQTQGVNQLRRQLAGRGLLDSGSLGAGVTDIAGRTQGMLAEGTQAALMNESDILMDLIRRTQDRRFAKEMQTSQFAAQQQMAQLMAQLQRENQRASQPSGMESFLSGLGGGVGGALPFWMQGT